MSQDLTAHHSRLERLERHSRHTRALACGTALLAATLLLTGSAARSRQVLKAERLELVTAQGVRQAILSADTLGFRITLLDARGRPVGNLRLNEEPRLTVETGRGRELAGLGAPKLHNLTE
jgi:hypothetical protein